MHAAFDTHQALAGVLALNPRDPSSLLSSVGGIGVFLALFAETRLLIGFFQCSPVPRGS